jgi:ribonuclease VapC
MVIDTSALLAIVLGEDDGELYVEAIERGIEKHQNLTIPASVLVEAGIVADGRGQAKPLAALLGRIQPDIEPLSETIAELAVKAFKKYGKGLHKAALNFGDCMSYATAEYCQEPLLFKGNDFERTPIKAVLMKTRLPS